MQKLDDKKIHQRCFYRLPDKPDQRFCGNRTGTGNLCKTHVPYLHTVVAFEKKYHGGTMKASAQTRFMQEIYRYIQQTHANFSEFKWNAAKFADTVERADLESFRYVSLGDRVAGDLSGELKQAQQTVAECRANVSQLEQKLEDCLRQNIDVIPGPYPGPSAEELMQALRERERQVLESAQKLKECQESQKIRDLTMLEETKQALATCRRSLANVQEELEIYQKELKICRDDIARPYPGPDQELATCRQSLANVQEELEICQEELKICQEELKICQEDIGRHAELQKRLHESEKEMQECKDILSFLGAVLLSREEDTPLNEVLYTLETDLRIKFDALVNAPVSVHWHDHKVQDALSMVYPDIESKQDYQTFNNALYRTVWSAPTIPMPSLPIASDVEEKKGERDMAHVSVLEANRLLHKDRSEATSLEIMQKCKESSKFKFALSQIVPSLMFHPSTPYNTLLLFHSTGSGKTIAALNSIAPYLKEGYTVFYVSKPSLFAEENALVDECAKIFEGNHADLLISQKTYMNMSKPSAANGKIVKLSYPYFYSALTNRHISPECDDTREYTANSTRFRAFRNRDRNRVCYILDECHEMVNTCKGRVHDALLRDIITFPGTPVLYLSATPFGTDEETARRVLQQLLKTEGPIQVFDELDKVHDDLLDRLKGMVSYVQMNDAPEVYGVAQAICETKNCFVYESTSQNINLVRVHTDKNETGPCMSRGDILLNFMDTRSPVEIKATLKKMSKNLTHLVASAFDIRMNQVPHLYDALIKPVNEEFHPTPKIMKTYGLSHGDACAKIKNQLKGFPYYCIQTKTTDKVIAKVSSYMNDKKGLHVVFSGNTNSGRVHPGPFTILDAPLVSSGIAKELKANLLHFGSGLDIAALLQDTINNTDTIGGPHVLHYGQWPHGRAKTVTDQSVKVVDLDRFNIWKQTALRVLQHPNNKEGKYIRACILDGESTSGVNIFNAKSLHIVGYPQKEEDLTQQIGRVFRACGHANQTNPQVAVYLYETAYYSTDGTEHELKTEVYTPLPKKIINLNKACRTIAIDSSLYMDSKKLALLTARPDSPQVLFNSLLESTPELSHSELYSVRFKYPNGNIIKRWNDEERQDLERMYMDKLAGLYNLNQTEIKFQYEQDAKHEHKIHTKICTLFRVYREMIFTTADFTAFPVLKTIPQNNLAVTHTEHEQDGATEQLLLLRLYTNSKNQFRITFQLAKGGEEQHIPLSQLSKLLALSIRENFSENIIGFLTGDTIVWEQYEDDQHSAVDQYYDQRDDGLTSIFPLFGV